MADDRDHEHGSMNITEQERTFAGFMWWSSRVVVTVIVLLILLYLLNG